ncbi:hypothetical protein QE450_003706 [Paenibacillus sp. SORGH_AS306]|uniref:Uncharacterized protein n=1 Tax=Paenibacillus kyungheensis TaxID=1452732 RepID=A0AAX3M1X3_9BACL|nr:MULTISPECIES: hypothetical protein [Paenibacillus]MDQ1236208.1 hypothetical protein [Paenibacillus sp. SORGH_AS_0306]MDR6108562.1 hypothetical protein [Paenibacillus sp. SORGH_AS_0338]WCT55649.1 hypothetical protein PQ456_21290 [Paenibacillus kyungheensis]WDF51183.1 hypothetical protein PQ460_01625 [Paenibacillus sp. KACC 21273]
MQPGSIILTGIIVVAVVAVAVVLWIVFPLKKVTIHPADPILPAQEPQPDHTTQEHPAHHPNIVDLSAFRERKHLTSEQKHSAKSADIQPKDTTVPPVSIPPKLATVRNLHQPKQVQSFSSGRLQKCSYCKKDVKHLTFYANDNGGLVGVCKDCEHIAKRQDLLPL